MMVTMQYGSREANNGGLRLDLLWTNPSPTASFAAQTVSVSLSEYKLIMIEYCAIDTTTFDNAFGLVGSGAVLYAFSTNSNNRNGRRKATISGTGIDFTTCAYNGGTTNTYCIPQRIFGVR